MDEEEVEEDDGSDVENNEATKQTEEDQGEVQYEENDVTLFQPTEDELYCYDIWLCPDSLPYVQGSK